MKISLWKRVLCTVMAICMLAGLTACGNGTSSAEASASAAQNASVTEAPEATEAPTATVVPESSAISEGSTVENGGEDLKTKWASLAGKKLKVATSGQQAGWSQDDGNGGVEGMDIDVMNYIADYYGMEIEWVVADPTGIWGMLQSGEVDTIACVTTVNEDRLGAYWFTNTYAWESYSIVSRTEDGVPEPGDLSFWDGKTVLINGGDAGDPRRLQPPADPGGHHCPAEGAGREHLRHVSRFLRCSDPERCEQGDRRGADGHLHLRLQGP